MMSKVVGRKSKSWFIYSIAIASSIFIVFKLVSFTDWAQFLSVISNSSISLELLLLTILLPFIIIYLESVKWRYLLAPTVNISQERSFKSVIMGISTGIFTPGRVGEIAGRLIADNSNNKLYVTSMFVVGSLIQTLITVVLGLIGIIFLQLDVFNGKLLLGLLSLAILLLLFWTLAKGFQRIFPNYYPAESIDNVWLSFRQTSIIKVLITTLISLIKYSVYSLQLYLALHFFNPSLDLFATLPKIAIFYFGVTFLPGFLWADLGIRGSLSLFLFATTLVQGASILIPIYFIWLLNSSLPALVGLLALLNHKRLSV